MKVADIKVLWLNASVARRDNNFSENSCIVMFWCWRKILISLHIQIHTGECADRPGGGSGGEDSRPGLVFGWAQGETQRHWGDAATGACVYVCQCVCVCHMKYRLRQTLKIKLYLWPNESYNWLTCLEELTRSSDFMPFCSETSAVFDKCKHQCAAVLGVAGLSACVVVAYGDFHFNL